MSRRPAHSDQSRYTNQITPEDPPSFTTDCPDPDPMYSTLDQSKVGDTFCQPTSQTNPDRTSPEFDPILSRNNSSARLLNTDSSTGGRIFQVAQDGARSEQGVDCAVTLPGYTARATVSSAALGRSSNPHASFTDHSSMIMAERRAILATKQVTVVDTHGQASESDYEVVDPKYRTRHNTSSSSSSSKLGTNPGHASACVMRRPPPDQVRRHNSLMDGGAVWQNRSQDDDADYAQLNRSIPNSVSTRIRDRGSGRVVSNDGSTCGRRGHSASIHQVQSSTSSSSVVGAGGGRPTKRQMSLPGRTERSLSATSYSRPCSDNPRASINSCSKVPLSPPHEESPPSYREAIFSDSSMMDNDAYETSQVRVEHRLVKSTDSLSSAAVDGGEGEVSQFWYRNNASDSSLDNMGRRGQKSVTRLDLAPYAQVSNSEIDARTPEVEQGPGPTPYIQPIITKERTPEAEQAREQHRASSQSLIKPTPYIQPTTNVTDLTVDSGRDFSNMVAV